MPTRKSPKEILASTNGPEIQRWMKEATVDDLIDFMQGADRGSHDFELAKAHLRIRHAAPNWTATWQCWASIAGAILAVIAVVISILAWRRPAV